MKASTDSVWKWITFDTGERWILHDRDYIKILEKLLSPSQFVRDFKKDGIYNISNKRYLSAREYYKSL